MVVAMRKSKMGMALFVGAATLVAACAAAPETDMRTNQVETEADALALLYQDPMPLELYAWFFYENSQFHHPTIQEDTPKEEVLKLISEKLYPTNEALAEAVNSQLTERFPRGTGLPDTVNLFERSGATCNTHSEEVYLDYSKVIAGATCRVIIAVPYPKYLWRDYRLFDRFNDMPEEEVTRILTSRQLAYQMRFDIGATDLSRAEVASIQFVQIFRMGP